MKSALPEDVEDEALGAANTSMIEGNNHIHLKFETNQTRTQIFSFDKKDWAAALKSPAPTTTQMMTLIGFKGTT